jgi:hypothetical protein
MIMRRVHSFTSSVYFFCEEDIHLQKSLSELLIASTAAWCARRVAFKSALVMFPSLKFSWVLVFTVSTMYLSFYLTNIDPFLNCSKAL